MLAAPTATGGPDYAQTCGSFSDGSRPMRSIKLPFFLVGSLRSESNPTCSEQSAHRGLASLIGLTHHEVSCLTDALASLTSPAVPRVQSSPSVQSRFGHQLRTSLIQNWYFHYIDYDGLKDSLKTDYETDPTPQTPKPARKPWAEDDEQRFVKLLESELDKVYTFQKVKTQEIIKRIRATEQEVNEVVGGADPAQNEHDHQQDVPSEEDFILLEEDLSDIIADVHDLAKFTQLNYTGFQKIIKKHDVSLPVDAALEDQKANNGARNSPNGS